MSSSMFRFEPSYLKGRAAQLRSSYEAADPFPHAVLDDLIPSDVIDHVLAELPPLAPTPDAEMGATTAPERAKTAFVSPSFFGAHTTNLFYQLNSSVMLDFLQDLTGVSRLIADTRLDGGGYHLTRRGGRLAVHTDFSHHRTSNLRRRLNLILYLNKDWKNEYGGHLELWDKNVKGARRRVLPVAGRCVVFSTDSDSPHGQPDPLMCPPDRGRQSLALYYYDNPSTENGAEAVGTRYLLRPSEQGLFKRAAKAILRRR